MTEISVLDLCPIVQGSDARIALANSVDLVQLAEQLGYLRYWVAEHHNLPGVASSATAVVIGRLADATTRIRVGAGGVMLPNHAPLVVAEQFGTLEALHPGRIDLGIGRAPGSDGVTAHALRRTLAGGGEDFPRDLLELMAYLGPAEPGARVRAIPGEGAKVPIYILGSSLYGAQAAAALGLPFAFASHFAPAELDRALALYRARFRPSERLAQPYVIAAAPVVAAETDAEAERLFTSIQLAFLNLRLGRPGPMPPPDAEALSAADAGARALLGQALECAIVGDETRVRDGMARMLARTAADELIITAQVFDHAARRRSLEIAASAFRALG